ncbi:uncharacterized protein (DUF2147 family) [Variovorax boronicumulans]|jgi:uncharacterized protein (DUF2147 family)|uniref:DUF2147 domain-containing protein n=1 Tax=Variovorax paradoxus (strain EPS) TaxID=595537 RepID=E6V9K6_VARPE|nr:MULTISPECIES: DUF2147 domain-containing protein [Variovorax]ADU35054.1 Protein of unknown function DUF2147 [Variovorax paradoxus EPS]MDP9994255.1 uncharacterized protein (DUF2147 family) [Variovorax boronicumulans]MDQ0005356.1 uncharacterized protein (DUF2147 family) [Variovorax boronicumulans]MDQ0042352.1 uncharacterized protein (DUF2147 family) [Variovorax boronicumulans]
MKSIVAAIVLAATAVTAMAQSTPVGLWRNADDKTGEVKAEIRIAETNGALSGRIEKSLKKDTKPDATCDECSDDRKGKPITGLEIIRGGKKAEGKDVWEGGKILDPENGKEYRASFTPIDGGKKLEVRGYLGPFWRTQTWTRAQ